MSDTWLTLRTFSSLPMAELARLQLVDAKIPCRLLNAEVMSMNPLLAGAVGFIPLQVLEEHLEDADAVLQKVDTSDLEAEEYCRQCGEPLDDRRRCPMCGHPAPSPDEPANAAEETEAEDRDADEDGDAGSLRGGTLDGLREFAKSAISAYLIAIVLMFGFGILVFLISWLD